MPAGFCATTCILTALHTSKTHPTRRFVGSAPILCVLVACSLVLTAGRSQDALFVHVPAFEQVPRAAQLAFAKLLIDEIAHQCASRLPRCREWGGGCCPRPRRSPWHRAA